MEVLLRSDTHYIQESECASKRPKLEAHCADTDAFTSSSYHSVVPVETVETYQEIKDSEDVIKCKICSSERFLDEQTLSIHWMDNHKKEALCLFMDYACGLCLDSFTNKNVLEAHMQERHREPLVEQCVLLQCSSCRTNLANPEELLPHVLLMHSPDLRLSDATKHHRFEGPLQRLFVEPNETAPPECNNKLENQSAVSSRRFNCKIRSLKFDLSLDLGRHHQAAHVSPQSSTILKSERSTRPLVKKGLKSASCKNITSNTSMRSSTRCLRASDSVNLFEVVVKSSVPELSATRLGRSAESRCSAIAKALYPEMKRTKARPSSSEILSIASSACCRTSLHASLQLKYGNLPARTHLTAAKLCSQHSISVEWHREAYICPKGCARTAAVNLPPLMPSSDHVLKARPAASSSHLTASERTMDESHCVVDSRHFSTELIEKSIVLCDDVSSGRESVPVACVVEENLLNAVGPHGETPEFSFPWESFVYVTKPLLGRSTFLESESPQLQCACAEATCSPRTCDHVYLFDIDFEDAKDIYGESIRGRFPYDERGRIILQEGYLVYECNQRCRCSKGCQNRVLQNGVQLKLEIFKTESKGWGVRSSEAVPRGSFVCEYIGEVVDEDEADERRIRRGEEGCKYFYEVDALMSRLIEGQVTYVIDASEYGNVSRYINHSCSPNLVSRQVLVESQLAHIGFYASRDIAAGEEVTYDFRSKKLQLPGKACPCLCGASNCRGTLH